MRRWTLAAAYLAVSLLWGSVWIANDMVRMPPLRAGAIRFGIGALLLAVPAWVQRTRGPVSLKVSCLLAVTLIALPYVLVVWAAQQSSSALSVVLFAGLPLVTAFLMRQVQAVGVSRAIFQAGLIGAGGMALIVFDGLSFSAANAAAGAVLFVAVLSHAASLVYAKRALHEASLLGTTAVQLGVAALLVFLSSMAMERGVPSAAGKETIWVLAVTGMAGAVGFVLYYWLLREMEAYQVATLQWTAPLVAIIEGVVAMRASPPWSVLAGAVVVLGCTVVTICIPSGDEEGVTLLVTSGPNGKAQQKLR